MAGGNAVIFKNLEEKIGARSDVRSSFQPIDMFPPDLIAKIPPISLVGALKNSVVAHKRFRALEKKAGVPYDAAYFFQHTYVTFLRNFRKRIPYVLAMDGVPLWYARHGFWYTHPKFDPESRISKLKTSITRSVYAQAYHLLPLSTGVRDSLVEDYGIPGEKISVVPPGIDIAKWTYPDRSAPSSAPLKILFVGGDFIRKGGDVLVAVAQRPEFSDVEFHFVTNQFGGKASPNIVVHSGIAPNSGEIMELYRGADLFVLPTREDTHSIAALEAMAMGVPVISTRIGGIIDIILEGETGYFVPTDDADTLADRIRRLRASREVRVKMGRKCRERVENTFNLEKIIECTVDVMKRAAGSRC